MEESKKYLYTVTDPCYLLHNDAWKRCCDKAEEMAKVNHTKTSWDYDAFDRAVEDELRAANKGFAFACDTGFGDWDNHIIPASNKVKVTESHFYADAGMVCVVEVTPELKKYLEENKDNSYNCGAFFESEEPVNHVNCVGDQNWEVLNIRTRSGVVVETEPEETEDDEDDYYENNYDEDYE